MKYFRYYNDIFFDCTQQNCSLSRKLLLLWRRGRFALGVYGDKVYKNFAHQRFLLLFSFFCTKQVYIPLDLTFSYGHINVYLQINLDLNAKILIEMIQSLPYIFELQTQVF